MTNIFKNKGKSEHMAHGLRRGNYRDHDNYLWVLVNTLQLYD